MTTLNLHPAAAASLAKWHDMVARADVSDLRAIVHPDATFRSPVAFKATADGLNVVLEFSARVGDKGVKGIDFIRFDEDGLITDFEVMMRPMNGVQALAAEMGARLGALLPAFKAS